MDELIPARQSAPGSRRVRGLTAITIRHLVGDKQAAEAVRAAGMAWTDVPGELMGNNPWLVWRSPQEKLAIGFEAEQLNALQAALSPGRCDLAMAADVSDALAVFELHGPHLDEWLAHLVDATAIPREPDRCSRCRLADVPVLLLRLEPKRLWMVVDNPVRGYLENWLAFSHEGAFSKMAEPDA